MSSKKSIIPNNILGDRIKEIRKINNLTQADFANVLGTSTPYISEIEANKYIPGGEFFHSLNQIYKVNINWLLTGEGDIFISEDENKKLIDVKDIPKENIKEWIEEFWRTATDKEKIFLETWFERSFPEYSKWIIKKSEHEKKLKTG